MVEKERTPVITVEIKMGDKERAVALAKRKGLGVGPFVRMLILRELEKEAA